MGGGKRKKEKYGWEYTSYPEVSTFLLFHCYRLTGITSLPCIRAELVNTTAVLFVFHYLQLFTLREVAKNRTVCGFWPRSFPALKLADHTTVTMPGVGGLGGWGDCPPLCCVGSPISASGGLFPSTGGTHMPVAS